MPEDPVLPDPRPEGEVGPDEVYAYLGDVLHWAAVSLSSLGHRCEARDLADAAAAARDMESSHAVHPRRPLY